MNEKYIKKTKIDEMVRSSVSTRKAIMSAVEAEMPELDVDGLGGIIGSIVELLQEDTIRGSIPENLLIEKNLKFRVSYNECGNVHSMTFLLSDQPVALIEGRAGGSDWMNEKDIVFLCDEDLDVDFAIYCLHTILAVVQEFSRSTYRLGEVLQKQRASAVKGANAFIDAHRRKGD